MSSEAPAGTAAARRATAVPLPYAPLTSLDRLPRVPLAEEAAFLRSLLDGLLGRRPPNGTAPQADWLADAELYLNRAALFALHRGDRRAAWRICGAHLAWTGRLAARHGREADLLYAVQPHINQGRLYAAEGRTAEALDHFALHLRAAERRPCSLAGRPVTPHTWDLIFERNPAARTVLANVYCLDSVKALLRAREPHGVLDFVRAARAAAATPGSRAALAEGEILATARLGRRESALALIRSALREAEDDWCTLVLLAYEALCRETGGAAALEEIAAVLEQPALDHLPLAARADLAALVAGQLRARGREKGAVRLARALYGAAVAARDEVAQHRMLTLLADGGPGAARWERLLGELRERSWYEALRTSGTGPNTNAAEGPGRNTSASDATGPNTSASDAPGPNTNASDQPEPAFYREVLEGVRALCGPASDPYACAPDASDSYALGSHALDTYPPPHRP
ncbi:hypothetical protein [Streptomyces sp. ODS28]|uniref:hypothetical protein n=1 Tax=Streptomyces sp. ODS28 TaxID=3136688 RepID=UPI0031ED72D3